MTQYTFDGDLLKVQHSAGVFSCYTVRLEGILDYYNTFKRPPVAIDSSRQFEKYKGWDTRADISPFFFKQDESVQIPEYTHPTSSTSDNREQQFSDYAKLNFTDLKPFVERFFAPAGWVRSRVVEIYEQFPTFSEEFCGVMYRGTCKKLETNQPSHTEFAEKVISLKSRHLGLKFFIQTDEPCLFARLERMLGHESCYYLPIQSPTALGTIGNYVANVIAMAKCKYLVTTSGNGELWLRLFRGNNRDTVQWLSQKEFIYGQKNESYDPKQRNFWLES